MGESDINAVNAILDIHTHKGEEQSCLLYTSDAADE